MKDLENLTDQVPESARSKNLTIEISETANKILFQFENFSEYTRTEVKKIIDQIIKRDQNCQTMLKELLRQFEVFKKAVTDFEQTACQVSYSPSESSNSQYSPELKAVEKDRLKVKELEVHIQAIKLHMGNTKDFLKQEALGIENRVNCL